MTSGWFGLELGPAAKPTTPRRAWPATRWPAPMRFAVAGISGTGLGIQHPLMPYASDFALRIRLANIA